MIDLQGFTWTPLHSSEPTLRGVDLQAAAGERVLVVGGSGSGKSTLLNAVTGVLGTSVLGEAAGSIEVRGRVGLVPQSPASAIVADRVGRDVAFGPENLGLPRDEIWRRVDDALAAVGLDYGRQRHTSALSGGERHRLALAGVLALSPDLVLLDEPTSMLDDTTAAAVRAAVLTAVGQRSMVVVEHRFEPWLPHVDRVVVLDAGAVVFDGPVEGFLRASVPAALWMPGRPTPEPEPFPAGLVTPRSSGTVRLRDVSAEQVTRTLRGVERTRVLHHLDADLPPGLVTAFTGPSGAGKSTALVVAGGLLKPTEGVVETVTPLGWCPQDAELGFVATTARAEVEASARAAEVEVDADALLAAVGLAGRGEDHPYRMSGGEQRRLGLAAAVAHRPGLVLADEPTVGQDRRTWALVAGWLGSVARAGAVVAVSTHDADLQRDRIVALSPSVAS